MGDLRAFATPRAYIQQRQNVTSCSPPLFVLTLLSFVDLGEGFCTIRRMATKP
jgi:hypothetical protein